ncbi:unnamed protein product [Trichobilharzia regenti]|nr:unnamed protein product [Trichobilharzia regenti]
MNLYFSSVASQPSPGHSSLSKMNSSSSKYCGQLNNNNNNTNNNSNNNNLMYSSKPHVTLTNALDMLTGNTSNNNNINHNNSSNSSYSHSVNSTGVGHHHHHNQGKKSEETTPVNIVLRRASVDSPWGFRVQGGRDYHLQLTICKVSLLITC